jgi:hypothetical protein
MWFQLLSTTIYEYLERGVIGKGFSKPIIGLVHYKLDFVIADSP